MNQVLRCMIVTAQDQLVAQQLAIAMARTSPNTHAADNMWIVGLSPTGLSPATHYISSGLIDSNFAALLGDAQSTFNATGGLIATLQQITDMYTRATILSEIWSRSVLNQDGTHSQSLFSLNPLDVISSMGLTLVR